MLEPGFKYEVDIQAALGLCQMRKLERFNHRRAELAARYDALLRDVPEIQPLGRVPYPVVHAWHLYVVRLDIDAVSLDRNAFMQALGERRIGTGLHFVPLHPTRWYGERYGHARGDLPCTEYNGDRILSLPLFPGLEDRDVDDIVRPARCDRGTCRPAWATRRGSRCDPMLNEAGRRRSSSACTRPEDWISFECGRGRTARPRSLALLPGAGSCAEACGSSPSPGTTASAAVMAGPRGRGRVDHDVGADSEPARSPLVAALRGKARHSARGARAASPPSAGGLAREPRGTRLVGSASLGCMLRGATAA
jgi:hypothetical protein